MPIFQCLMDKISSTFIITLNTWFYLENVSLHGCKMGCKLQTHIHFALTREWWKIMTKMGRKQDRQSRERWRKRDITCWQDILLDHSNLLTRALRIFAFRVAEMSISSNTDRCLRTAMKVIPKRDSHTPIQINTAGSSLSKSHSEIWFLSIYWNHARPDKTQTPGPDGVMFLVPDTAWVIILSVSQIREKQCWGMSSGSFFRPLFEK